MRSVAVSLVCLVSHLLINNSNSNHVHADLDEYKGFDAFPGNNTQFDSGWRFKSKDVAKARCIKRGYGGFVLWNGRVFYKNSTPTELLTAKAPTGMDTSLFILRSSKSIDLGAAAENPGSFGPAAERNGFDIFEGYDAFPGNDTLRDSGWRFKTMEIAKNRCIRRGYGGFVLWNGRVFYRNMTRGELLEAKALTTMGSSLFVLRPEEYAKARVVRNGFDIFENYDSFPGDNAGGDSGSRFYSLEVSKARCISCGYGGFTLFEGRVYYRSQAEPRSTAPRSAVEHGIRALRPEAETALKPSRSVIKQQRY